jgi:hypothetical protein
MRKMHDVCHPGEGRENRRMESPRGGLLDRDGSLREPAGGRLCYQNEEKASFAARYLFGSSEAYVNKWDFWDWCLAGLSVFGIAVGLLMFLLYALPQEPLVIPEIDASIRVVDVDDFPENTVIPQHWGEKLILVIRSASGEVTAVEGRSPADGCVLQWDKRLARVYSPCSYHVYNSYGYVVEGLDNRALLRYPVFERDGVINIGSGS